MGMRQDLNLTGNDYSNAATFTYVAYIAAEILSGMIREIRLGSCYYVGANKTQYSPCRSSQPRDG